MLTMQPSDVLPRSHRANPWATVAATAAAAAATDFHSSSSARSSPVDLKARPSADVFQNGLGRYSDLASQPQPPLRGLQHLVNGSRSAIDHDDLLAPGQQPHQRADTLSNASSPPSDRSDAGQQLLLEAQSQASSSASPRSADSRSHGASSPPTSVSTAQDGPYPAKPALADPYHDPDFGLDATPGRHRDPSAGSSDGPGGFHRAPYPLTSPLSPLVEPFSPTAGQALPPLSSLAGGGPATADLAPKRSSASLASAGSATDLRAHAFDSRAPSSAGSVSSGVTVHSLYAHPYAAPAEQPNGLPAATADLGNPNALTSAAFASLGAQLALNDRLSALSKAQDPAAAAAAASAASASGGAGPEEISTIFVVGFPDDMQEREFQNMFVFSPGFEAATLKTPGSSSTAAAPPSSTSSSSRDSASRLTLAPVPGLDGYGLQFGGFEADDLPPGLSLGAALGHRDGGRERDRDGGAAALAQQQQQQQQQRKQIIGFAKFRTRQEALDAVSVLSGRRVDAEKDCVLKAEMAKKNLHTKRGLATDTVSGSGSAVGVGNAAGNNSLPPSVLALGQHNLAVAAALSPQVIANALAQQQVQRDPATVAALLREQDLQREARAHQQQSAAFDAFHSVPASQAPFAALGRLSADSGSAVAQADPRYTSYTAREREPSYPGREREGSYGARERERERDRDRERERESSYGSRDHRDSVASSSSTSPYFRSGSLSGQASYGSLLQQLGPDAPHASSAAPSSAIGQTSDGYTRHAFYASSGIDEHASQGFGGLGGVHGSSNLGSRLQGLSLNTGLSNSARPTSPISGMTSPRGTNPADMNPPINTLYVGGLPAVLPSLTGPMSASHLEDSLRAVFSRSPGFKRLCFRQKSNGPMSFVEYESVDFATRALHDLYGHTLGGLVKGGIRLSYSKNPLGVRSGSVSATPTSAHTPLSPTSTNFAPFMNSSDAFFSNNTPTPNANTSRRLGHDVPSSGYGQLYRSTTPRSAQSPAPTSPSHMSTFSPFSEMGRGMF